MKEQMKKVAKKAVKSHEDKMHASASKAKKNGQRRQDR